MSNPIHVANFTDSIFSWNKWREENPDLVPDLSGAKLDRQSYVSEWNLSNALLHRLDISGQSVLRGDFRDAKAHGLVAENTSFTNCKFDGCELSRPAVIRDAPEPNKFAIEAYGIRQPLLSPVSSAECCQLRECRFYDCSFEKAVLDGVDFTNAQLIRCNFNGASLRGARFHPRFLHETTFQGTDFFEADLWGVELRGVNLERACLRRAILVDAQLGPMPMVQMKNLRMAPEQTTVESFQHHEFNTILRDADLRDADLRRASLVQADLSRADLRGARVFGVSAWKVKLDGAKQANLIATPPDEPALIVDNLEVAQFVYLLLNNERLRDVIDQITSKVVLILGNFSQQCKPVLETFRNIVRDNGYVPVLFDSERPRTRTLDEAIGLLARMAQFVIADVSYPRSVPAELAVLVRACPSVAFQPVILRGQKPYALLEDMRACSWLLPVREYDSSEQFDVGFVTDLIRSVEAKVPEIRARAVGALSGQNSS